jgi:hypothetical protein
MNKRKSILSILTVFAILITCFTNTYAANNDKLIIELKVGSTAGKINGTSSKVDKPYVTDKTIMVPLVWVTTAIGAEVNQISGTKTEIIYNDLSAEITVGSKSYTVNSKTEKLTVAPVLKNKTTMIPLEFISKNFPVTVTSDIKKGNIKIVLEDDGALTDLSFLTGGISSAKVGNSYFGWSLSVPSGSRIISNNFKSDTVGITNESRSLYFEISVESKKDNSLSDLYKDVLYSANNIRQSKIDLKAEVPYFQYIRLSEYDESLRVKVYDKGDYFYYLTINCYDNSVTPEQLLTDKYYENIINSFSFDYKGNVKGVQDISKVKNGQVNYYNYINLGTDVKYLPWSMSMPVKWEQVITNDDPFAANLGLDSKHFIKVVMNTLGKDESLEGYTANIKNNYDKYFNPKVYSFISSGQAAIAGTDAQNLKFSIKQAGKVYIIDEYYFLKGDFVYEISIKLPESEYEKSEHEYLDAVDSMTFYSINETNYLKDLDKYKNNNLAVRISGEDDPFNYRNKTYKWSIDIPGYWTKNNSYTDDDVSFENANNESYVMVNTIENTSLSKTITDEEKFDIMKLLRKRYNVTPIQSISNDKGYQVRNYVYKIENEEYDFYATIICNCFEAGNYAYCYISYIPDLYAADAAVKEVDAIWKSFKIIN